MHHSQHTTYEGKLLELGLPPWRKDDIKRTCPWYRYIKYFMARMKWRQTHGSKWLDIEWEQREQGQIPWTLEWSTVGWTWEETRNFLSLRMIDSWIPGYPVKWKGLKNARSSGRPTQFWEQPSCAAPNGKGAREPAKMRARRNPKRIFPERLYLGHGDGFTSKQVNWPVLWLYWKMPRLSCIGTSRVW